MSAEVRSIKALTFKSAGRPRFTTQTLPTKLGKNCLLVKVHAAALNPVDIKLTHIPLLGLIRKEKGIGKDFAGEVIKVGENVKDWQVNDRICGMVLRLVGPGSVASHLVIDLDQEKAILKVPKSFSYEQAAAFPLCYGTAFRAFEVANLDLLKQEKSSVLVLGGATAVGMFAIQLAKKWFSIPTVIATCSKSSESLVRELGADFIIDYRSTNNLPQEIVDTINTKLDGQKCSLVIDCIGGHEVVDRFRDILLPASKGSAFIALNGDLESQSKYDGGSALSYLTRLPFMASKILFGKYYGLNYSLGMAPTTDDWKTRAEEIFETKDIKILIDSVYDWDDWEKGWDKLNSMKSHGKIVLKME
ncbi:Yim1p [Sugiyamaella lignohabitans]|uniref:Yim1p n=1 Tax=Sugiyamaella lignohabitans TaxID=796027 RepID=A0A167EHP4_9ASCO|nr:Yim1p [Sugiyamaella lignohabitans]ANB14095.1 Yim1p [Sugiyamaella lignohabitans]